MPNEQRHYSNELNLESVGINLPYNMQAEQSVLGAALVDETVLNRLISRILVGEVKKVDGQKVQEVRIVYNFVGEICGEKEK